MPASSALFVHVSSSAPTDNHILRSTWASWNTYPVRSMEKQLSKRSQRRLRLQLAKRLVDEGECDLRRCSKKSSQPLKMTAGIQNRVGRVNRAVQNDVVMMNPMGILTIPRVKLNRLRAVGCLVIALKKIGCAMKKQVT